MSASPTTDWWQREKQRRMLRVLLFLSLMLLLIGYYYFINVQGRTGIIHGVNFNSTNYIAFTRTETDGNTSLCAVSADGSDFRKLTNNSDHSNKATPIWTVDGKSLVYSSNLKDGRVSQLYILGDGEPKQITYGSGNKFNPAASSDGKHIAYLSQGTIKTVTVTGNDVTQLMPPPSAGSGESGEEGAQGGDPQGPFETVGISPDGDAIYGVQNVANSIGRDGKPVPVERLASVLLPNQPHVTTLDSGNEVFASWEPNGKRVASSYTGIEVEGPQKKIVLISGINIWSFEGARGKPQNLFRVIGGNLEPKNISWSPDGGKIAFEGWVVEKENRTLGGIGVLDVTSIFASNPGGVQIEAKQVPSMTYLIPSKPDSKPSNPHWSSDGSRLVFEQTRADGKRDLWIINSDGTNPTNLTKGIGDNFDPNWSPSKPK